MFLRKNASRIRLREAQQARRNRLEITKALSLGHVSRRDLFKWGLFTTTGALAWKHGLNPFVQSAFGSHQTSFPHSPLFGVEKFSQPLPRLAVQQPIPLVMNQFGHAEFPAHMNERPASFWVRQFAKRGCALSPDDEEFRAAVAALDLPPWYAENIHVFERS